MRLLLKTLITLSILISIISCSRKDSILLSRERCIEYESVRAENIEIELIPMPTKIVIEEKLPYWAAYVRITNKNKETITLKEVWQFRGETTRAYYRLKGKRKAEIVYNHQIGVHVFKKGEPILFIPFSYNFKCTKREVF